MQLIDSRADLRALCLVSKTSRINAEPFLYSKIEWSWDQGTPPIACFLRTVLCRSDLALRVRSLSIRGDTSDHYQSTDQNFEFYGRRGCLQVPVDNLDLDTAVEFIKDLNVPYVGTWEIELRQGTIDSLYALLLSLLHNLRHLAVGQIFDKHNGLLGKLLMLASQRHPGLPTFERLRRVEYELERSVLARKGDENISDTLPFLYLPGIQQLAVSLDERPWAWPTDVLPSATNITSLGLAQSRECHLPRILSLTPRPKSRRWERYGFCTLLVLDKIGNALSYVGNTLEELTISAKFDYYGNEIEPPEVRIEGSLKTLIQFDRLIKIEVPLEFLTASFIPFGTIQLKDVVPRGIEKLIIRNDLVDHYGTEYYELDIYNVIESWLQHSQTIYTKLQSFSVSMPVEDGDWLNTRESFAKLCHQYGIEFSFITTY